MESCQVEIVTVDQFSKYLGTVQRRGWYPIGSNPTIEVGNSRTKVTVLGAVTENGDSFYCWTEEYLTAEHGIRFLDALTDEFGEELVVILDRGSYFYARDLWEFVSDERSTECVEDTSVERVCGSPLQVCLLPTSPTAAVDEQRPGDGKRFMELATEVG
jgi:hypothetical protein